MLIQEARGGLVQYIINPALPKSVPIINLTGAGTPMLMKIR